METARDCHTISMAGSRYGWEDFDNDARKNNMNRSQFFQHLYIKYKEKKRFLDVRVTEIIILLLLVMVLLMIIIGV